MEKGNIKSLDVVKKYKELGTIKKTAEYFDVSATSIKYHLRKGRNYQELTAEFSQRKCYEILKSLTLNRIRRLDNALLIKLLEILLKYKTGEGELRELLNLSEEELKKRLV